MSIFAKILQYFATVSFLWLVRFAKLGIGSDTLIEALQIVF